MRKLGLALVFLQVGCSGGSFSGGSSNTKKDQAAASNGEQTTGQSAQTNGQSPQTNGDSIVRPGEQKAQFLFGTAFVPTDFLFVIDNSSSMDTANDPKSPKKMMQAGFAGLAAARWPLDTRIGVTTTMPGDLVKPNRPHDKVAPYINKTVFEAGFLSLMHKAAQDAYRKAEPSTHGYTDDMCDSGWFAPSDRNPAGKPCLQVAIQSPFMSVILEAGLVVVKQLLAKNPNGFFRKNSNVNIVFVSDTEDPGQKDFTDFDAFRPTYEQLKELVLKNSAAHSLKLHGVVPDLKCEKGEESPAKRGGKTPYQDAIKASGGVYLDFCEGDGIRSDYKKVVESILEKAQPEPLFTLPGAASKIIKVTVNGAIYPSDKTILSADKRSLRVNGLNSSVKNSIEVIYAP